MEEKVDLLGNKIEIGDYIVHISRGYACFSPKTLVAKVTSFTPKGVKINDTHVTVYKFIKIYPGYLKDK